MDRETLSHYGWIVICVMIIAVMLAFATPFGNFVATGARVALDGLLDSNDKVLGEDHMNGIVNEWENEFIKNPENPEGGEGQTPEQPGEVVPPINLNHEGVIPEGGIYIPIDTLEELGPGEPLPETPKTGDEYWFGDYRYGYNTTICPTCSEFDMWHGCMLHPEPLEGGWSVMCVVDKEAPGVILHSICKKPIIDMNYTFGWTHKMTTSPKIPSTVVSMDGTYQYKKNLVNTAKLPDGITNLMWTYRSCESLVVAPEIPSSVVTLQETFHGCSSLKVAPVIPEGAKGISHAFRDCTSLETAPVIPASVDTMFHLFENCTSLTGEIIFNNTIIPQTNLYDCYEDTFTNVDFERQKITLKGTSSILDNYGLTGLNYCTTCNGWCRGHNTPYSVYYNKFYWGEISYGIGYSATKVKTGVVIYQNGGDNYIYSFTQDENGKWIADNYHELLYGGTNGDYYDDYGTHYVLSPDGKSIQYTDGWVTASGTLTLDKTIPVNGVQYEKEYVDSVSGYKIEFENRNDSMATFTDTTGRSYRRKATFISPYAYEVQDLGTVYLEIDELIFKLVK